VRGANSLFRHSLVLFLILLSLAAGSSRGQEKGSISGKVTDAESGAAVAYAQIVVMGTDRGAMAIEDGTYVITKIPPGTYDVKVMMMSYEDEVQKGIDVAPGQKTRVDCASISRSWGSW
jgi:hypothetical protein